MSSAQALNVFFSGPSLPDTSLTRPANDQPPVDRDTNTTSPLTSPHLNNTQNFVNDDSETDEVLKAAIRESLQDEVASRTSNQGGRVEPARREAAPAQNIEPKSILRGNEPNAISRLRSAPTHEMRNLDSIKHRRMSIENLESRSSRVEEEKILADRFLRYDQDEEYEISLAQDRAKDEQRRIAELQKRLHNPCDATDLFELNLSSTN
jgi:hypothetical protein